MKNFIISTTKAELSQHKMEEYTKYAKVINAGRQNPIWFSEEFFGIKLMDFQRWMFMNSWVTPYVLWLCCRGAGKTTLAAVLLMTKLLLIPNYNVFISTNSAAQSMECFKKIEDIALQRIPSFTSLTDIFAREVELSGTSPTGFIHSSSGYNFQLYNTSSLLTLSSNFVTTLGKRGSVFYDETAWQSQEQMASTEHFADVDAEFSLGTEKIKYLRPAQMPLQLLYASSAGDIDYPFYTKYRTFAKRMLMGDPNYFVCDLNADIIVHFSTVDGQKIKSHLTQDAIDKAIEEDPDAAERELFNRFRKGAGLNAVVKTEALVRNSVVRAPLLYNDTGKKKFILCYDPARNFDGSILTVFEILDDSKIGYRLRLVNMISMVDGESRNKTPLPMTTQLKIIKETMIKYNGDRAAEWENIELYIDAGSGGGGISAVADQLMEDWTDAAGVKHRGVIDAKHKQYETARKAYPNAVEIVHLIEPSAYKKVMYDALEKSMKLDLVEFTDYDGKEYLLFENEKHEFITYELSDEERVALLQINLAKNELSYMCRYDLPNGGVQYDLARDKKFKMHDDRAYTIAMGAYALSLMRRSDLVNKSYEEEDLEDAELCVSELII